MLSGKVVVREITYQVKYLKPASKGDTIFGVAGQWLIAVNVPWDVAKELENARDFTVKAEIIKENPERRYSLIKVSEIVREVIREREVVEHKDPEIYEFHGIRVKVGQTSVTKIKELVTEVWTPESGFKEHSVEKTDEHSYTDRRTTYEIIEENEITKLIQKSDWFYLRDPIVGVSMYKSNSYVSFEKFDGVSEDVLLDLSKYYVIAYPFLTCRFNDTYYHIINVYYNGQKLEVPMNSFYDEVPPPLNFRISLRRFALTRHYKSLLPYGDYFGNLEDFIDFVRSIAEKARGLEGRIKVKEITPFEKFLEIFYIRTPKRKLKALEQHFKLYENILKTLKDKPVLYISFPNKYGSRGANYACIRVEDNKYTVMGIAQVPITAITIKGKFEEAYKIVHGLKKLLSYQFAPKERKIAMLREDIEELRKEIEEKFGKPVSELHPEHDIMKYLFDRAEDYVGNNLALILYKARKLDRAPDNVTLLKIAGLIKSGKDYDYTVDRLKDVLEALRIAVKYEIKSKGYSSRLGVVFSGTAYDIARKVTETVNKVRDARMKALLAEILTEGENVEKLETSVGRLEALMRELASS